VSDLFYLAKPIVESLFYEDVVAWLDTSDIRYTPSVKFTGIRGYEQHFDFAIPKSKKQPGTHCAGDKPPDERQRFVVYQCLGRHAPSSCDRIKGVRGS
jgi:hypothetical protein